MADERLQLADVAVTLSARDFGTARPKMPVETPENPNHGNSDAAGDGGKVEPECDAAEVGALGAGGCGDGSTKVAGRADEFCELRVDFAELSDFIERRLIDLFLGVEAGAHGPFVKKVEERAGFDEADGLGVWQEVEGNLLRDAAIKKLI